MKNHRYNIKIISIIFILLALPTLSKESKGYVDLFNINTPFQALDMTDRQVSLNIDIRLRWKAWLLLGEPVIYSDAVWSINSLRVQTSDGIREFEPCVTNASSCIPSSVLKKIKLLDYSFLLPLYSTASTEYVGALKLDPGVYAEPDIRAHYQDIGLKRSFNALFSYNTPGSSSWSKTIVSRRHLFLNAGIGVLADSRSGSDLLHYVKGQDARAIFLTGFDLIPSILNAATVVSFEVSYFALSAYFVELQHKELTEKFDREAAQRIETVSKTVEYQKEDDFLAEFEQEYLKEDVIEQLAPKIEHIQRKIKSNKQQLSQIESNQVRKIASRKSIIDSRYLPGESLVSVFEPNSELYGYKKSKQDALWTIKPTYSSAGEFSQGLAAVASVKAEKYKSWGYINYHGDWVIKPSYYRAKAFHQGEAIIDFDYQRVMGKCNRVKKESWKRGAINLAGQHIGEVTPKTKHYRFADGYENGSCTDTGFHLTVDPYYN